MGVMDFFNRLPAPVKKQAGKDPKTLPVRSGSALPAVHAPAGALVRTAPSSAEALPAAVRRKAAERLAYVRLVDEEKIARGCSGKDACHTVAALHADQFPLLARAGKSSRSALTWYNYRHWSARLSCAADPDRALAALCDGYSRGVRAARGDKRFWETFYAMYLNIHRLPLTVAYDRACAKMRKEDKTMVVPTLTMARYQIDRIAETDPGKLILARQGEEAWRNQCCDFIRRDWRSVAAGECAVGDSRTFDTRVRVYDNAAQRWIAVRPTIAGLLDAKSWYMVSYMITTDPVGADTLIDTVRLYVRNNRMTPPPVCYFDNGKDYCAQGFATDYECDGHKHSIFRELGIRLLNSLAYNARAKLIERAFRDMMQQFDKMFPDYLGSRPGDRSLASDYYDSHPEELPSLQQFCAIFEDWLAQWHRTPKSGEIHKGRSPLEVWSARPVLRDPISEDRLRLAFCRPVAARKVGRGPSVKWANRYYHSDALRWGTRVLLKTDTLDEDHVLCCTPDGALIGEARTRDSIRALDGDRDRISAGMARQRRQLREARTAIDDLTGGRHIYSPIELFLADADTPHLTGGSIAKVKGSAHRYTHKALGVIEPPEASEPPKKKKEKTEADIELESLVEKAITGGFDTESDKTEYALPTIQEKNDDNSDYELPEIR